MFSTVEVTIHIIGLEKTIEFTGEPPAGTNYRADNSAYYTHTIAVHVHVTTSLHTYNHRINNTKNPKITFLNKMLL
jgi:hypothetical protein